MSKETIKIDSHVLEPWNKAAWILGQTVEEYLERHLVEYISQERKCPLVFFAEEFEEFPYKTRGEAQMMADRFEEYAIEQKLRGGSKVGMISTEVVARDDGCWTVMVNYLSPGAKRGWHSLSNAEDNNPEN